MTIETEAKPKRAPRQKRAAATPDATAVAAAIASEFAKAIGGLKQVQTEQAASPDIATIAKKAPATWTVEETALIKREHERLNAALEALPYVGEQVAGTIKPGTVIGQGSTSEYAPYTTAWFTDVEARRKDRLVHNGRPVECKHPGVSCSVAKKNPATGGLCGMEWPDYDLIDVFYQGTHPWLPVTVSGVTFNLLPGVPCKLPPPHYAVYMKFIRSGPINDALFAPPQNPGKSAGYYHVSERTGLAVILGKGPLDTIEAREAKDFKPEGA